MPDFLPDNPIVDINGVLYRYTTVKQTQDDMLVHVQNKDTEGTGYIFRETDDWSGLPSGTIVKLVPVDNISADRFGEGSIEVEGTGEVISSAVQYNYRIDSVQTVQNIDSDPPDLSMYTYEATEATSEPDYSDEEIESSEDEEEQERALRASKGAVELANAALFNRLAGNGLPASYTVALRGGEYKDAVTLIDANLPDSKSGLRVGLAQQILHQKMVMEQYER
jgi:hypothetical protein